MAGLSTKRRGMHAVLTGLAVSLLLTAPPLGAAARDPMDYTLREYAGLLLVALLGGLVSWYAKVKSGALKPNSFMHLVGELTTSAFAGLLAFWLCEWANSPRLLTACLVGISGHMGARAIAAFEQVAEKRWGAASTSTPGNPPPPGATP